MKHNILHLDSVTSTNSWLAVEGRDMPSCHGSNHT